MIARLVPSILHVGRRINMLNPLDINQRNISYSNCEGLLVEPRDQVLWIKLNRPDKYNAVSADMFSLIAETLDSVNKDNSIKSVVLTGNGDYYSSGNDLKNLMVAMKDEGGPRLGLSKASKVLERFVASFINAEKLLIAAVNGPSIGIMVTTLPLFDYVIASDKSTFHSPFTALGQCPEACSSMTFPQLMGRSRSSELLLMNRTWTAAKAQNYGLVSDVVPHEKFGETLDELLYGKHGIIKSSYPHSTFISQSLIKDKITKDILQATNKRECEALLELWLGAECVDALQRFMTKGKK